MSVCLLLNFSGRCVICDLHEDVPRQILTKYWNHHVLYNAVSVLFWVLENYVVKNLDAVFVLRKTL